MFRRVYNSLQRYGELFRVFEELATPNTKLSSILDASYHNIPSSEGVEEARCYLEDLATSSGASEENWSKLLTEYDEFMIIYQSLGSGDVLSERKYPFLARTAKRILACNSNSMTSGRCFSIMSLLNSSKRNRMTMGNLRCYKKAYLHLLSKAAMKREIVKDDQEIDDEKVFYENSQSEETEIGSNLMQTISLDIIYFCNFV